MEHIQNRVILIWFSNIYFAEIPNNERNVVHKSKNLFILLQVDYHIKCKLF